MPLSPLDLLFANDDEQQIISCLTKRPQLTAAEIAERARLPLDSVERCVDQLVGEEKLVEQFRDGRRVISVRYGSNPASRIRNLPPDLLTMLAQSGDDFLTEVTLTQGLTEQERKSLFVKSTSRKLLTEEVLSWQGKMMQHVGVVKHGLIRRERLQGKRRSQQQTVYLRRGDWFGLVEMLTNPISTATYTAIAESEVIVWRVPQFSAHLMSSPALAQSLSRYLGQELRQAQSKHIAGSGKLWVIKAARAGDGATTLAANLAALCAAGNNDGRTNRTVLWSVNRDRRALDAQMDLDGHASRGNWSGKETLFRHRSGVDVLLQSQTDYSTYPAPVQLDIVLTNLQAQYDTIVCDTGDERTADEFVQRLRGQAEVLLTIARRDLPKRDEPASDKQGSYTRPDQKQITLLNRAGANGASPAFQMILPDDETHMQVALTANEPIVLNAPDAPLSQAMQELHRRLSLTHTVAIFIPSTLDVDQAFDNTQQVKQTIHFLGGLFGGAVSNQADGVWKSEDKGLVTEQVTIVRAFVSKQLLDKHLDDVIDYATQLKTDMKQEAVAVDVDSQLVLV